MTGKPSDGYLQKTGDLVETVSTAKGIITSPLKNSGLDNTANVASVPGMVSSVGEWLSATYGKLSDMFKAKVAAPLSGNSSSGVNTSEEKKKK